MDDARKAVYEAGMNDFVSKPVDIKQLFTTLKKWVKTNEYVESPLMSPTIPMNDIDDFPSLEGVDTDMGLDSLGSVTYRKLLVKFADRYRNFDTDFRDQLKNDKKSALQLIHSLKGVSGSLFVNKVYLLATEFEKKMIEDGDVLTTGEENLVETLSLLIQSIDELFSVNTDEIIVTADESVDRQNFESLVIELSDLLKSFSASSIDYLDRHDQSFRENMLTQDYEVLRNSVENYDFDEALKIFKNME